jgi:hypothetical protein
MNLDTHNALFEKLASKHRFPIEKELVDGRVEYIDNITVWLYVFYLHGVNQEIKNRLEYMKKLNR